jgi:hypothetical protein
VNPATEQEVDAVVSPLVADGSVRPWVSVGDTYLTGTEHTMPFVVLIGGPNPRGVPLSTLWKSLTDTAPLPEGGKHVSLAELRALRPRAGIALYGVNEHPIGSTGQAGTHGGWFSYPIMWLYGTWISAPAMAGSPSARELVIPWAVEHIESADRLLALLVDLGARGLTLAEAEPSPDREFLLKRAGLGAAPDDKKRRSR